MANEIETTLDHGRVNEIVYEFSKIEHARHNAIVRASVTLGQIIMDAGGFTDDLNLYLLAMHGYNKSSYPQPTPEIGVIYDNLENRYGVNALGKVVGVLQNVNPFDRSTAPRQQIEKAAFVPDRSSTKSPLRYEVYTDGNYPADFRNMKGRVVLPLTDLHEWDFDGKLQREPTATITLAHTHVSEFMENNRFIGSLFNQNWQVGIPDLCSARPAWGKDLEEDDKFIARIRSAHEDFKALSSPPFHPIDTLIGQV